MTRCMLNSMGGLVTAAAMLWPAMGSLNAQGGAAPAPAAKPVASAAAKNWVPPRTPDGQPDIQGMWIADDWGKPLEARLAPPPRAGAAPAPAAASGAGPSTDDIWVDVKTTADKRPMIVDPPDGRIPWLPWAAKAKEYVTKVQGTQGTVVPLFLDPATKCLPYGVPRSNSPNPYSGYQFMQRAGAVVIYYEQGHQFRVIPLDDRPRPSKKLSLWMGTSRGRWEGNTLVVDVTNLTGRTWIFGRSASQVSAPFHSDAIHVVEKFIFSDANTVMYEATIEDPNVYSRPWTIGVKAFVRAPADYQVFEYACVEGNKSYSLIKTGNESSK